MSRTITLGALSGLLALGAAAFFQSVDFLPSLASREGAPIDGLLRLLFSIAAAIAVLVIFLLGYSVVAFRRQPGDLADGRPVCGNAKLELLWTLVPLAIVVAVGVYGQVVWWDITGNAAAREQMVVEVTAFQFGWQFRYAGSGVTSNELVLPRGAPVLLRLSSRDVIHSFWVREFRVKMDAVPGMETHLGVTPTAVGEYEVWCAELCGLAHAYMRARVRVVEPGEFTAWLTTQAQS